MLVSVSVPSRDLVNFILTLRPRGCFSNRKPLLRKDKIRVKILSVPAHAELVFEVAQRPTTHIELSNAGDRTLKCVTG